MVYRDIKRKRGREEFIDRCNKNDRRGMAWWRLGICKFEGSRKGKEKGTYPLCLGKEDSKHILLECPENKYWIRQIICKNINDAPAYRKMLSYNQNGLTNMGIFL